MADEKSKSTFGERFLLDVQNAESKGLLFAVLAEAASRFYARESLSKQLQRVSSFDSVAVYQSKLAKVRIEYNARAVKEIHGRLVGLNNFGEDNYKYKEKIIRKLNLLINNYPTLDEIIYIAMAEYIARGFGNAESFKHGLEERLREDASGKNEPEACSA